MDSFEYYLRTDQQTVRKLMIKNKSQTEKLFKILHHDQVIQLLIVQGNKIEEVELDAKTMTISVQEVLE